MQGAGRRWAAAHQLHRGGPRGVTLLCQYANHHPQKAAVGALSLNACHSQYPVMALPPSARTCCLSMLVTNWWYCVQAFSHAVSYSTGGNGEVCVLWVGWGVCWIAVGCLLPVAAGRLTGASHVDRAHRWCFLVLQEGCPCG